MIPTSRTFTLWMLVVLGVWIGIQTGVTADSPKAAQIDVAERSEIDWSERDRTDSRILTQLDHAAARLPGIDATDEQADDEPPPRAVRAVAELALVYILTLANRVAPLAHQYLSGVPMPLVKIWSLGLAGAPLVCREWSRVRRLMT